MLTRRAEINKGIDVWIILVLLTIFFVSPAWSRIFDSYFERESFLPIHQSCVVRSKNCMGEIDSFAREQNRGSVGNRDSIYFHSVKKCLPITNKVTAWNGAEIFDLCSEDEGISILCCELLYDFIFAVVAELEDIHSDIRSNGLFKSLLRNLELPSHYERVNENQASRYLRPKKLPFVAGLVLCAFGLMLVFKVLNYVYLNTGFNVNMAVSGFFFGAILFWVGGWVMFSVLGMV